MKGIRKMEYKVVKCSDRYILESQVNSLMQKGYKPIGGVSFLRNDKFSLESWTQAMLKE